MLQPYLRIHKSPVSPCDLTLLQVDRNGSASVLGAAAMGFKARRIVLPALRAKVHVTADAAALPEATSEPCRVRLGLGNSRERACALLPFLDTCMPPFPHNLGP